MSLKQFAKFDSDWIHTGGVGHIVKVESIRPEVYLPRASDKKIVTGRVTIGTASGNSEIKEYIRSLWEDDTDRAFEIVYCESGWHTDIISRTSDVGLFQINLSAHWRKIPGDTRAEKIEWLQNWRNNVEFAYMLYAEQGWEPWVCHGLVRSYQ